MSTLGSRIKVAAERVGGLEKLADLIPEMSRRSLTDYANDKTEPRASLVAVIAATTGVRPGWLLAGEGDMQIAPQPAAPVSVYDIGALTEAIELIEQGLAEAGRVATPAGKAEMISAAYEILRGDGAASTAQIIRLVKAS